jgi:peptidoglycan hydrolase-like amidase
MAALLGFLLKPQPAKSQSDLELQVGVVQRFGSTSKDSITLQASPGDRLTIKFLAGDRTPQTLVSESVKLEIAMQPLKEPKVRERVVLTTHRSFESAEESANYWRSQGIPVEVAQPKHWQVWAKRDVYKDAVVRRLLMQSLQKQGLQAAFVDSQVLQEQPRATFTLNGYRYTRDYLEISAEQGAIQITSNVREQKTRRLYGGSLRLQPNTYGTYTLVNQVPLETYLRGVVPHEIGTRAASSALEVQAILARTYALRNLRRFAVDNYQLCADTQCQAYYGLSGAANSTDQAIAKTRGLVLTYQNELVDAVYSSTTGGITAPFNDIWQGPNRPYLQAIVDSVKRVWDLSRNSLANEQNFRRFIQQKQGFNEEEQSRYFRWRQTADLSTLNN